MRKIMFLSFVLLSFTFNSLSQITVTSTGKVGIKNTNPAYWLDMLPSYGSSYSTREPLHFNHWGRDPRICSNSHVVFYRIDYSSFIDVQCKTLYEYSDSTAKESITLLKGNNIAKIKILKGVNYNWKGDSDKKKQTGFLAQNVEQVIPEAVYTNDSTHKKLLAYSAIMPYLVGAIKEQWDIIELLEEKVEKIENVSSNVDLKNGSLQGVEELDLDGRYT